MSRLPKVGTAPPMPPVKPVKPSNTLTCVYCGMAYPEGTPPHGSQILTDHIKVCEKHPLRAAEATIQKLRSALVALVGAGDKETLEQMDAAIRLADAPQRDKTVLLDAVHVLLDTMNS